MVLIFTVNNGLLLQAAVVNSVLDIEKKPEKLFQYKFIWLKFFLRIILKQFFTFGFPRDSLIFILAMHFVQRKNITLQQCCGSGSASFWDAGSGSASEWKDGAGSSSNMKFRIRNHICKEVEIQETLDAHSGAGEGLYASSCRFASLWWGAGSGPHLSLRSDPYPICTKVKTKKVDSYTRQNDAELRIRNTLQRSLH
jgi:hypothetical protein